ncbi:TetR/AcrR family transcriptional regulator [Motiliproteus sp.]|uniref:TetR/AcrR family transcriptional regulator n=1 Tax=Motiliproteus sp. TaxID=1898955 RepID=UPI003BAAA17B
MNSTTDKSPDSRSSRELWLSAAFEALVQNGVGAVKIQPLAEQLKLSRTSFYWYFKDRKALLSALIEEWNRKNTGGLTAATEAYAESLAEAVLNVISAFLDANQFDSKLDFAIRSWALQDPDVMEEVRIADEVRLQALIAMFEKHGYDRHDADVRARTIYLVQIGYISMQVQEDLATRMARIPNYVATYTGQQPTPNEIARFHARHHFVPES